MLENYLRIAPSVGINMFSQKYRSRVVGMIQNTLSIERLQGLRVVCPWSKIKSLTYWSHCPDSHSDDFLWVKSTDKNLRNSTTKCIYGTTERLALGRAHFKACSWHAGSVTNRYWTLCLLSTASSSRNSLLSTTDHGSVRWMLKGSINIRCGFNGDGICCHGTIPHRVGIVTSFALEQPLNCLWYWVRKNSTLAKYPASAHTVNIRTSHFQRVYISCLSLHSSFFFSFFP